jgi:hypothetical protein
VVQEDGLGQVEEAEERHQDEHAAGRGGERGDAEQCGGTGQHPDEEVVVAVLAHARGVDQRAQHREERGGDEGLGQSAGPELCEQQRLGSRQPERLRRTDQREESREEDGPRPLVAADGG